MFKKLSNIQFLRLVVTGCVLQLKLFVFDGNAKASAAF